jgi:hypothetical protein
MKREDDENLWDLLGHNPDPKLSPFFARNIVRQIRQEQSPGARSWFWMRRLIPASVVALSVIATVVLIRNPLPLRPSRDNQIDPIIAKIDVQDYEVVADLDNLLASDENSPWDENSAL